MIQIDVTIMGQPYRLACRDDEKDKLKEAVAYLDKKMCGIVVDCSGTVGDQVPEWSAFGDVHGGNQAENRCHEQCAGSGTGPAGCPFLTMWDFLKTGS